jgi:hypothetical protein
VKTHEIVLLQGTQSDLLSIYSLLEERVYNKVDKALGILRVFPSAGPVHFGKNFRRLVVSKTPLGIVSPDTLAHMVAALNDPALVCVSLKWNDDPFFSDAISSTELQQKGLRFGSFFSNSMSMLRCSLWESLAQDETLPAAEDVAWALAQLQNGHLCRRLHLPFSYRRRRLARDAEFAQITFHFAHH